MNEPEKGSGVESRSVVSVDVERLERLERKESRRCMRWGLIVGSHHHRHRRKEQEPSAFHLHLATTRLGRRYARTLGECSTRMINVCHGNESQYTDLLWEKQERWQQEPPECMRAPTNIDRNVQGTCQQIYSLLAGHSWPWYFPRA